MPRSVTSVPTSANIVYVGKQANLSDQNLALAANKNKVLYNDNGNITFLDYGFLSDIIAFPDLASFPAVGQNQKLYLDTSLNRLYRYVNSQYFYFPHDVFTKTESDTKYVIRSSTVNDMTGSQINNLLALTANDASITTARIGSLSALSGFTSINGNNIDIPNLRDVSLRDLSSRNNTVTGNMTMSTNNATLTFSGADQSITMTGANAAISTSSLQCEDLGCTVANVEIFGAATAQITTLRATTLGTNLNGNNRTISNLGTLGVTNLNGVSLAATGSVTAPSANITTLTATTANVTTLNAGTLGSDLNGNNRTISNLGTVGVTTLNGVSLIATGDVTAPTARIGALAGIGASTSISGNNIDIPNLRDVSMRNLSCGDINIPGGYATIRMTGERQLILMSGTDAVVTVNGVINATTANITNLNPTTLTGDLNANLKTISNLGTLSVGSLNATTLTGNLNGNNMMINNVGTLGVSNLNPSFINGQAMNKYPIHISGAFGSNSTGWLLFEQAAPSGYAVIMAQWINFDTKEVIPDNFNGNPTTQKIDGGASLRIAGPLPNCRCNAVCVPV